ncbi:MAG: hypothetical protein CM15mP86_07720 [Gammaproteobacteria bacterium]|nr:MAG: hypothetical protein CM15mP86_07720 [Gammaproteobacteria bacterium]
MTNYTFDENNPLKRSEGANTSDSTFAVLPIKGKTKDKDGYLVEITQLLLSESLTPIIPIFQETTRTLGLIGVQLAQINLE